VIRVFYDWVDAFLLLVLLALAIGAALVFRHAFRDEE
jgi:hypothetical protein